MLHEVTRIDTKQNRTKALVLIRVVSCDFVDELFALAPYCCQV